VFSFIYKIQYLMTLSVAKDHIMSTKNIIHESRIGKNVEGSGCGLF
jgi:hypothetical protein